MFLGLARDRLERLNASPSATVFSHLRIYAVLLFVLLFDLLWYVNFSLMLANIAERLVCEIYSCGVVLDCRQLRHVSQTG